MQKRQVSNHPPPRVSERRNVLPPRVCVCRRPGAARPPGGAVAPPTLRCSAPVPSPLPGPAPALCTARRGRRLQAASAHPRRLLRSLISWPLECTQRGFRLGHNDLRSPLQGKQPQRTNGKLVIKVNVLYNMKSTDYAFKKSDKYSKQSKTHVK